MSLRLKESPPENHYIPGFDGLRAFAVVLVMLNHFVIPLPPFLEVVRQRGHLGVEIFFALSGYLVMRSFHSSLYRFGATSCLQVARDFFVRRGARLFVPYYMVLFTVFFAAQFLPSLNEKFAGMGVLIPSLLFYFFNYGSLGFPGEIPGALNVTWSLAFEEQFYALLAFVGLVFSRRLPWVLFALCCLSICWRLLLSGLTPDLGFRVLQMSTHLRLDSILFGGLVYLYHPLLVAAFRRSHWIRFGVWAGVLTVFAVGNRSYSHALVPSFVYLLSSFFFAAGLLEIIGFPKGRVSRFFSQKLLVEVGKVSYEIYLLHQLCNGLLVKIGWALKPFAYTAVMIGGSVIGAVVFHRWVGKPSQEWLKSHFLKR